MMTSQLKFKIQISNITGFEGLTLAACIRIALDAIDMNYADLLYAYLTKENISTTDQVHMVKSIMGWASPSSIEMIDVSLDDVDLSM